MKQRVVNLYVISNVFMVVNTGQYLHRWKTDLSDRDVVLSTNAKIMGKTYKQWESLQIIGTSKLQLKAEHC